MPVRTRHSGPMAAPNYFRNRPKTGEPAAACKWSLASSAMTKKEAIETAMRLSRMILNRYHRTSAGTADVTFPERLSGICELLSSLSTFMVIAFNPKLIVSWKRGDTLLHFQSELYR